MPRYLPLGSIATLSSDRQVLTVCLGLLAGLNAPLADKHRAKRVVRKAEEIDDLNAADRHQLRRETKALIKDLNRYAPPLAYVGYQPASPDHLGVWIDLYALHMAEQSGRLTQVIGPSWRGVKSPYVLETNGGSMTLYRRKGRIVLWST